MDDDEIAARIKRGTWSYEMWRSNKTTHANFPRTTSPFGRIFVDKGTRRSTCFCCDQVIVRNTPRFVLLALRPQTFLFRNGGRSKYVKSFAHVSCIRGLMKGVKVEKNVRACVGCELHMDELVVRACTSSNGQWGWLCRRCLDSGMFVKCASCGVLYPKRMCSLSLNQVSKMGFDDDENHPAGSAICDSCSLNYRIRTLKSQTRQERADKTFEKKVEKAITQVQDWFTKE